MFALDKHFERRVQTGQPQAALPMRLHHRCSRPVPTVRRVWACLASGRKQTRLGERAGQESRHVRLGSGHQQGATDDLSLMPDQVPMSWNRRPNPANRAFLNRHLKGVLGALETTLGDGHRLPEIVLIEARPRR